MSEQDGRMESRAQRALARVEQRRQLMALPARKRMDALLEAQDARALVRSLPTQDLYITIQEVGLADAVELVQLASPRQFQSFLDLGAWQKDRLEPHRVLTWLRAARGEDPEDFLEKVERMDLEVLEVLLRTFCRVHDLEENPDVAVEGVTLQTPEGRYLVEFTVEGAELAGLRGLLNDLIARNPFEAARLLEAVRWEVPSEMEEAAFRFRTARLADLGFPPVEEAQSLFAYVDPARFPVRGHALRAALLPPGERVDPLEVAVRDLLPDEQAALQTELRLLANQALVAEGAEPGDLDAQRAVLGMVRDVLSLGLEYATGGDLERGGDVVREEHLRRLFQLGYSLTLRLKFRADRLMKRPLAEVDDAPLLLPHEAAVVAALRSRHPRRALRVEGAEPVPFRSRRELAETEEALARAETQVTVLAALLGGTRETALPVLERFARPFPEMGAEGLLHAALAHGLREGVATAAPFPTPAVDALLGALLEAADGAPQVRPEARARAVEALTVVAPGVARTHLEALVDTGLTRLADELGRAFLAGGVEPAVVDTLLPLLPRPLL